MFSTSRCCEWGLSIPGGMGCIFLHSFLAPFYDFFFPPFLWVFHLIFVLLSLWILANSLKPFLEQKEMTNTHTHSCPPEGHAAAHACVQVFSWEVLEEGGQVLLLYFTWLPRESEISLGTGPLILIPWEYTSSWVKINWKLSSEDLLHFLKKLYFAQIKLRSTFTNQCLLGAFSFILKTDKRRKTQCFSEGIFTNRSRKYQCGKIIVSLYFHSFTNSIIITTIL